MQVSLQLTIALPLRTVDVMALYEGSGGQLNSLSETVCKFGTLHQMYGMLDCYVAIREVTRDCTV
jgi:hypothetical protein